MQLQLCILLFNLLVVVDVVVVVVEVVVVTWPPPRAHSSTWPRSPRTSGSGPSTRQDILLLLFLLLLLLRHLLLRLLLLLHLLRLPLHLLHQTKELSSAELLELYSQDSHLKAFVPITKDAPLHPVIYDSNNTVLSLPPIINGEHSKITLNTRNVFIEVIGSIPQLP